MRQKMEPRWRVSRIAAKNIEISTVSAPTAEAAIKKVIKEFDISEPAQQARLVARPIA